MRPLLLEMRGFRSHVSETTFDFTDRNLVAIVGPTGAGKSTILDGISYALYAKTPREKRNSSALISTRSKKATLTYRFALGDETFEINRSIPAASDDHMVSVGTGEKVVGSTAITTKVEELLGLDFEGFASSVLLAQGRFDLFLKATTKERTGILKGIFRIERIDDLRKAAVARRDAIDTDLARIEGEFKQIPADAAEHSETKKKEVVVLEARIAELEKAVPEEKELLDREKEVVKEKADAETEIATLTKATSRLPSVEDLEALAESEADCIATTSAAAAALESCTKAAEKATAELEKLQTKDGDLSRLHSARAKALGIAVRHEEIERMGSELQSLKKAVAAANKRVEEATARETQTKAAVEEARATLEEVKRVHAAHELRSHLAKGEPCPVCEQAVATLPKSKKVAGVAAAEKALIAAEAASDAARSDVVDAKNLAAAEERQLGSTKNAHASAVKALDEERAALVEIVGKAKDPLAEIESRLARLEEAAEARESALTSREQAQRALNKCSATKERLDKDRQRYSSVLIEVAVHLKVDAPTIEDPASALITKVVTMSDRALERGGELHAQIEKAATIEKETGEALARLRVKVGVETSLADSIAEAKTSAGIARHVIADLATKIERAKELAENERTLKARRALFHQLADDLSDRNFVNFLLEDRRRLLSELASERLHEMTKRYRFSDDGEFNIVDELEGDVVRGAHTLSGGETFLASLALALGLAETAARHGGRLQSFFLDEGFDSLDAEMLDQALDGIERIVTPERLIALVSHVPALAARVEDKIVLGKDAEGTTIVLEGASR
jgi:exonuclease SbcC